MLTDGRDARGLPANVLGDLRRQVVAAVESGLAQVEAARRFGVSRQTVGVWVRDYRDRGEGAFRPGRRGRKPGEQLVLTAEQQLWVARAVTGAPPDAKGLDHPLWTRQAVIELVWREFRVRLGVTTAGNYLVRWGFPLPQDLLRELRARMPPTADSALPAWLPGAEVVWVGHGRAAESGAPVLHAVSNRCSMSFLACSDPYDPEAVQDFVTRLLRHAKRRLNVVVTWLPQARPETRWLIHEDRAAAVQFIG